jgi:5'-nucleotidase
MRILLANDDGINSTGFSVLEKIARELTDDVWVCAPETEQSAVSHSLTIHRPLRLRQIEEKRFAVDGTPTDCVLLAVNRVMKDKRPDLVMSGVNHGRNIAEDVTYSGTIAAAMEATLLGIRAIAFSQQFADGRRPDWETAAKWGAEVARKAIAATWPKHVLVNINFPAVDPDAVKGVAVVPHGIRKIGDVLEERIDPRGRTYFWIGTSRTEEAVQGDETDVAALREGHITVTPLHLDLNHAAAVSTLRQAYA